MDERSCRDSNQKSRSYVKFLPYPNKSASLPPKHISLYYLLPVTGMPSKPAIILSRPLQNPDLPVLTNAFLQSVLSTGSRAMLQHMPDHVTHLLRDPSVTSHCQKNNIQMCCPESKALQGQSCIPAWPHTKFPLSMLLPISVSRYFQHKFFLTS